MFVLDTNVISELMKDRPNAAVLEWMDNQSLVKQRRLEDDAFVLEAGDVFPGVTEFNRGQPLGLPIRAGWGNGNSAGYSTRITQSTRPTHNLCR